MRTDTLRIAAAATAIVLLAGCSVGADYVRPRLSTAADFHEAPALASRVVETLAPPLNAWWQGFDDPELVRIVDRVIAQNLDLAASAERVAQARALAQQASAARLPSGSLDGTLAHEHQSLLSPLGEIASNYPQYDRSQTLASIGAGASWEADLAGGLGRSAEARIAIAGSEVKNQSDLLELVKLRRARGVGTFREVAQTEALLLHAEASIPPLRRELAAQGFRLDVLMGQAPGTVAAEMAAAHGSYAIPSIDTAGGPAELLRRRPDVIAAERRLAASNARVGVALAAYYPSLSLSGLLGFESLDTGRLFSAAAFQPAALAGLHWRLFDFGRVDAEVAQAEGANREALLNYRASMLRATQDVESAIVAIGELEQQHRLLTAEVQAHTQARDAALDAYRGGAVSLIEVLDQDRQLLAAQDLLAEVHTDDARSAVAAFRALGGGWTVGPTAQ